VGLKPSARPGRQLFPKPEQAELRRKMASAGRKTTNALTSPASTPSSAGACRNIGA
jgi:hypothetical protein